MQKPRLNDVVTGEHLAFVQLLELVSLTLLRANGNRLTLSQDDIAEAIEQGGALGVAFEAPFVTVEVVEREDVDRVNLRYEGGTPEESRQ